MMYEDSGGGWVWMAFMPLVWIALLGLLGWAMLRLTRHHGGQERGSAARETPEEILDRRFASGEIDAETYTDARERLAAHRGKSR
ncbi:hypothetical protein GCM10009566_69140 [Streptomyces murinus]|nr:hypothetical protein GO605_23395 [Streptomyces murinus]